MINVVFDTIGLSFYALLIVILGVVGTYFVSAAFFVVALILLAILLIPAHFIVVLYSLKCEIEEKKNRPNRNGVGGNGQGVVYINGQPPVGVYPGDQVYTPGMSGEIDPQGFNPGNQSFDQVMDKGFLANPPTYASQQ
jgi:hypothetical protein